MFFCVFSMPPPTLTIPTPPSETKSASGSSPRLSHMSPNGTRRKEVPHHIYKQMGERGYLAGLLGVTYPVNLHPAPRQQSVPPESGTLFHEMLLTDELSRAGSGGLVWNLIGGFGIGCPPLVKFGKKPLVDRILPGILAGDKRICLAITEPDAGSDVANLTCEAKLSEDGKHYIVNGEKKWITNGIWSDYFTTAVRTGEPGMNGVSVLLIEREPAVSAPAAWTARVSGPAAPPTSPSKTSRSQSRT